VVGRYADPRITLLRHDLNRGVGPARNTGVDRASGEWVICLDSDDELVPGALEQIRRRTEEVGPEMGGLRFMCRMDSGAVSPDPPFTDRVVGYRDFLLWQEEVFGRLSETFPVVRRSTFQRVRYAKDRSLEGLYHLDFAQAFRARLCPDIVRLYHTDANNRYCGRPRIGWLLERAADEAGRVEMMLARHGTALREYAPRVFAHLLCSACTWHLLAGHRLRGLRYAARVTARRPVSLKPWAIAAAGLLGPGMLARVKSLLT